MDLKSSNGENQEKKATVGGKNPTASEPLAPLSTEEFQFAINVGFAAGSLQMPISSLSKNPFAGPILPGTLRAADIPESRAAFAILDQFQDKDKGKSAMIRFFRLREATHNEAFAQWIRQGDKGQYIHQALVDEIATEPLGNDLNALALGDLNQRVKVRAASGAYEDDEEKSGAAENSKTPPLLNSMK